MSSRDEPTATPPAVTGAVSVGTAPLPFLAVYAVLFIAHGSFAPAHPPDITGSQTGELIAGIVAAVVFVLLAITLWYFLGGRRRWPFALGQLAVFGATIWLLVDQTRGGTSISVLVLATTLISLVLAFAPDGWRHVGLRPPAAIQRLYGLYGRYITRSERPVDVPGTSSPLPVSGEPTLVEPAVLRHRHRSGD